MEELLAKLQQLLTDETIEKQEWLTDGPRVDPLVTEISDLAEEILIQSDGKPDFRKITMLSSKGFTVTRGEGDSFGWLSGIIKTPKGKIVFG